MKLVEHCVICGARITGKRLAQFAPFIAHRVFDYPICRVQFGSEWLFPPLLTNMAKCDQCNFIFSQLRFDDDEMGRIYRDYRGPEYTSVRDQFEPGYAQINPLIGNSETEVSVRQAAMHDFFKDVVDPATISSVLDYGGDKGQHIPHMFAGARRYVYDISNIDTVEGVEVVNNLNRMERVDFVIISNVLEHVPYPGDLMRDIKKVCGRNTILFLDVPLEMPDEADTPIEAAPGVFHEHINYFTTRSLEVLARTHGFRPLKAATIPLDLGWARGSSLYLAATPEW